MLLGLDQKPAHATNALANHKEGRQKTAKAKRTVEAAAVLAQGEVDGCLARLMD